MRYIIIVIFTCFFNFINAQETLFMGFTNEKHLEDPTFEYGLERKVSRESVNVDDVKVPFEKYLLIHRTNKGIRKYFEALNTEKETFFLESEFTNSEFYLNGENKASINIGFLGQFDFSALPSKDRIWLSPSNRTEKKQSVLNVFFDLFNKHYAEDKENLKVLYFAQTKKNKEKEYYFILWRANNEAQLNSNSYLEQLKEDYKLPNNTQQLSLSQNSLIPSHIFYLEVSNLSDVEGFYNNLNEKLEEIKAAEGEFILYLANGQNPSVAKSKENYSFVTNGILTLTTFTDGVHDQKELMVLARDLFQEKGKKFYLNYYFSDMTVYRTFKRKLVNEILGAKEIAKNPIKNIFVEIENEEGEFHFTKVD